VLIRFFIPVLKYSNQLAVFHHLTHIRSREYISLLINRATRGHTLKFRLALLLAGEARMRSLPRTQSICFVLSLRLLGLAIPAQSTTVPIGGLWSEFSFTPEQPFAAGCAPADPAGLFCLPSVAGNSTSGVRRQLQDWEHADASLALVQIYFRTQLLRKEVGQERSLVRRKSHPLTGMPRKLFG